MAQGYEIEEDGTILEVEVSRDSLDSARVICVVDESTKSIFLWKGASAGIRKKFIGARAASKLRSEFGFHFNVRPIEEGEGTEEFFSALSSGRPARRPVSPGGKSRPKSPRPPRPKPSKTQTEERATPPPPMPEPVVKEREVPEVRETEKEPKKKEKEYAPVIALPEGAVRDLVKEIEAEDIPAGFERELLVIGDNLYAMVEKKRSVFGEEETIKEFELLRDPLDGSFMASQFTPRVVVRDGKIAGIELLKGAPKPSFAPAKKEASLDDLADFLKEELKAAEEEGLEWELITSSSKKLVRK